MERAEILAEAEKNVCGQREQDYLRFRSVVFNKTYSCVVQTEGEDALRGEIEHQAMKLEQFSGIPWRCEAVKPFPEKGKEGRKDG